MRGIFKKEIRSHHSLTRKQRNKYIKFEGFPSHCESIMRSLAWPMRPSVTWPWIPLESHFPPFPLAQGSSLNGSVMLGKCLVHSWLRALALATPSTQKTLPPDLDTTRSFIAPVPWLTGTTLFNTQPTSPGLSLILHFSQIQFLHNTGEYLKLLGNLFLNCVYLSSALEYSRQPASAWSGLWLKPGHVSPVPGT